MSEQANNVVALVGVHALDRALGEAQEETELCFGADIPFYPRLTVRANALAVRMILPETEQARFWELLKVAGLRSSGWNVGKFKGNTGGQRLWGLVLGLMKHPPALLALEPMAGMSEHEREGFAALLRWCGEQEVSFAYTATRLKEVMGLGVPQRLRLAAPEGWIETDTRQMEEALTGETEKSWNKLQQRWEGETDGKAAET